MTYPHNVPPAREHGSSLVLGVLAVLLFLAGRGHPLPRRDTGRRLPRRDPCHGGWRSGVPGGMGAAEMSEFRECASYETPCASPR